MPYYELSVSGGRQIEQGATLAEAVNKMLHHSDWREEKGMIIVPSSSPGHEKRYACRAVTKAEHDALKKEAGRPV